MTEIPKSQGETGEPGEGQSSSGTASSGSGTGTSSESSTSSSMDSMTSTSSANMSNESGTSDDHNAKSEWNPQKGLQKLFQWPVYVARVFAAFAARCLQQPGMDPVKLSSAVATQQVPAILRGLGEPLPEAGHGDGEGEGDDDYDEMNDPNKKPLNDWCEQMDGSTMSTSFSGIETPATCLMMLGYTFCHELGIPLDNAPHMTHKYAIEWNSQARGEILKHPSPPEHLFGDIEDFWDESVRAKLPALKDNNLIQDVLVPLVKNTKCTKSRAWCYKHNAFCEAGQGLSALGLPSNKLHDIF